MVAKAFLCELSRALCSISGCRQGSRFDTVTRPDSFTSCWAIVHCFVWSLFVGGTQAPESFEPGQIVASITTTSNCKLPPQEKVLDADTASARGKHSPIVWGARGGSKASPAPASSRPQTAVQRANEEVAAFQRSQAGVGLDTMQMKASPSGSGSENGGISSFFQLLRQFSFKASPQLLP